MASAKAVIQDFAESTSIHGLLFIFRQKLSKCNRFVWVIIFLLFLAVCLYECKLNVDEYLKMEVTTSIVYQPVDKVEFPSITFCSEYQFKKSVIGNVSSSNWVVAQDFGRDQKSINFLAKANLRTCSSNHESEMAKMVLKYGYPYFYETGEHMKYFLKLFAPAFPNFETDVEKCWVDSKQVDCAHILINRPIDDGFCFTFNMGAEFQKIFANNSAIEEEMSKQTKHPKVVRFLLKTNQSDNCETLLIKRGVGYYAVMTDKDSTPIMLYDTPIYLTPGYLNEVIIKPIHYIRNTENLGHCTSKSNVFLTRAEKYMQSLCYFQCIMRTILQQCQCYPPNFIFFHDLFVKNARNFKISDAFVQICNMTAIYCARSIQDSFITIGIVQRCAECVPQCDEFKYNFRLMQMSILVDQLKENVPKDIIQKLSDDKTLKKNYVDVLFKFENNYVEIVQENQAITIIDLFINLGNNIGLFLGMSFMSNFEVLINVLLILVVMGLRQAYWVWRVPPVANNSSRKNSIRIVRVTRRQQSSVLPIMQSELVQS